MLPAVDSPVVNHQVYDLLVGQTRFDAKIGEGHVITGLGLVFEVLALAQPSLLEARVGGQVSIEKFLRHGRIRVNGKWLVGDLLLPSLRDALLLFGVGHAVGFEEFRHVAGIVPAVGLALDFDRLWIRRVLAVLRSRHAQNSGEVGETIKRPTVGSGIQTEQRLPAERKRAGIAAVLV